jgi:hypothetical protein
VSRASLTFAATTHRAELGRACLSLLTLEERDDVGRDAGLPAISGRRSRIPSPKRRRESAAGG